MGTGVWPKIRDRRLTIAIFAIVIDTVGLGLPLGRSRDDQSRQNRPQALGPCRSCSRSASPTRLPSMFSGMKVCHLVPPLGRAPSSASFVAGEGRARQNVILVSPGHVRHAAHVRRPAAASASWAPCCSSWSSWAEPAVAALACPRSAARNQGPSRPKGRALGRAIRSALIPAVIASEAKQSRDRARSRDPWDCFGRFAPRNDEPLSAP